MTRDPCIATIGRCIYCLNPPIRSREHVFPFSIGGSIFLRNASCERCAGTTSYIEGYCARNLFPFVRHEIGYPTRRRKERPSALPMYSMFGDIPVEMVPVHLHPGMLALPLFPPPGVLMGRSPDQFFPNVKIAGWSIHGDEPERRDGLKQSGYRNTAIQLQMKLEPFVRLIAKIAHAGAVGKYGIDGFVHRLPTVILDDKEVAHWIGNTDPPLAPATSDAIHSVEFALGKNRGTWWVYAFVNLFRFLGGGEGMPKYWVVVGEARERAMEVVRKAPPSVRIKLPLRSGGKAPSAGR